MLTDIDGDVALSTVNWRGIWRGAVGENKGRD